MLSEPSGNGLEKKWRKGSFLRPFCHLLIKGIRYDSHPFIRNGPLFSKTLLDYRANHNLTQEALSAKLGVGLRTMNNWERGWIKPTLSLLPNLKFLLSEACSTG